MSVGPSEDKVESADAQSEKVSTMEEAGISFFKAANPDSELSIEEPDSVTLSATSTSATIASPNMPTPTSPVPSAPVPGDGILEIPVSRCCYCGNNCQSEIKSDDGKVVCSDCDVGITRGESIFIKLARQVLLSVNMVNINLINLNECCKELNESCKCKR